MAKRTGFNNYIVEGDITKIILKNKEGETIYALIDTQYLQGLIDLGYKWYARYHKNINNYYVQCNQYIEGKHKVVALHKYIMECSDKHVDHIEAKNTLDNRKCNLRIIDPCNNSANRKGANSNSKTGVRNVSWIKSANEYWVQIMRKGERFKWIFKENQFEEACNFAEIKRKELFGEFAGKGKLII